MKKSILICVLISILGAVRAQKADTGSLKKLYDRTLDFSEEKLDSIYYNAVFIEEQSKANRFEKGKFLSTRLKGLHSELSGNYEDATRFYLSGLNMARINGWIEYEISALCDLAIVNSELKRPVKSLEYYKQCIRLAQVKADKNTLISSYCNLGAIYNQLNLTDSALNYLVLARQMAEQNKVINILPTIFNNTGNVYFKKKDYSKALEYFKGNKLLHDSTGDLSDRWYDNLNIADTWIEWGEYDSASSYLTTALDLAKQLKAKKKEAETYELFAKLNERLENYKNAYEYFRMFYMMDTAFINESNTRAIGEMEQKFHIRDSEKENKLLQTGIEKEKLRNRNLQLLIVGVIITLTLVCFALWINRRAKKRLQEVNAVINRQKENLSVLNQEKNALISIVSHDLSTPFSSIEMWGRILEKEGLSESQENALKRIRDTARNGEKLIRNILEIERDGTGDHKIELEETNIAAFVDHLLNVHKEKAAEKKIVLFGPDPGKEIFLLTDQELFRRILDNIVSNAIKFSPAEKLISVNVSEDSLHVDLEVADQGLGILKEDQEFLFSRYTRLSAHPTAGETSTGLGLSIVKRLVSELNGSINFSSDPGIGTSFTVSFKK